MPKVEIYTKSWCPFCGNAKQQLESRGLHFEEIDITTDLLREAEMVNRSGRTSVPQVFVDGHHVGGSDDLLRAGDSGLLDTLLAGSGTGEIA